jgi:hypothetical protein
MNNKSRSYNTVELESYGDDRVPDHSCAATLLDWLVDEERFDVGVARIASGPFRRLTWSCIVLSSAEARARRELLLKIAQRGFSLVIAVKVSVDELLAFFLERGFTVSGRGRFCEGDEHDPCSAAPDSSTLEEIVYIASRLSSQPLCVFAHEAEPIYVLHD